MDVYTCSTGFLRNPLVLYRLRIGVLWIPIDAYTCSMVLSRFLWDFYRFIYVSHRFPQDSYVHKLSIGSLYRLP